MSGLDFVDNGFHIHKAGGRVVNFQAARFTTTKVDDKLYNAWLSEDGSYVIMERDFTTLTTMYFIRRAVDISVTVTLTIDWANRANLTYVDYDALFA